MKSIEELNAIKREYRNAVAVRTQDYNIRIVVGMGNSGLVAGARDILKALVEMIEEAGLSGKVIVTQMARVSRVGRNPVVEVVEDGETTAIYSNVTVDMARRIVAEHIKGGSIVEEYLMPGWEEDDDEKVEEV